MQFFRVLSPTPMAITEKIIQGVEVGSFGRGGQSLYRVDIGKI
ncbi:MAG: hypothetical protein ACO3N9_04680 [Alphaproteobacteria bacterium]